MANFKMKESSKSILIIMQNELSTSGALRSLLENILAEYENVVYAETICIFSCTLTHEKAENGNLE